MGCGREESVVGYYLWVVTAGFYTVFPLALYQAISMAKLMHGGVQKVLFGTDFPCFAELYSQKEWVQCIRDLEYPAPLQIMGLPEITEADKEMILGKNSQEALKLA